MTLLTAGYEQAIGYTARVDRIGVDALFGGPGVDFGFGVVPSTVMTFTVSTGRALVSRTSTVDQGSYLVYNDSSGVVLTIPAADPTYTRIDNIVIHVYDTALGDVKDGAYLEVIAGVVNSGVAPATPANAITIRNVTVPAGTTNLSASAIFTDTRIYCGPNGSPGDIMWISQSVGPSGWTLCNGQALSRAAYPDLNAVYARSTPAYPFGNGDGSTTFNLPNILDRVIQGVSPSALGATGGESAHLLTVGETPVASHAHVISDPGHSHGVTDYGHHHLIQLNQTTAGTGDGRALQYGTALGTLVDGGGTTLDATSTSNVAVNGAGTGVTTNATGAAAGSAHNNRQPFIALWPFVKT